MLGPAPDMRVNVRMPVRMGLCMYSVDMARQVTKNQVIRPAQNHAAGNLPRGGGANGRLPGKG